MNISSVFHKVVQGLSWWLCGLIRTWHMTAGGTRVQLLVTPVVAVFLRHSVYIYIYIYNNDRIMTLINDVNICIIILTLKSLTIKLKYRAQAKKPMSASKTSSYSHTLLKQQILYRKNCIQCI